MPRPSYDAVVIGSGQGGGPLASALAGAGRRTALIERKHIGGTCLNEGCTPTKTMIASAAAAYMARHAAEYGVQTGQVTVDMARVRQRKRDLVESFVSGSQRRLENTAGLDVLWGQVSFLDPHDLAVRHDGSTDEIEAATVIIDTGARPARPPLPGLDQVPALDSTSIMELDVVPEHLLVLGGGYVGVEFGQMFRRFGSRVTIVQRGDHLLNREDADVADAVADILREDGIEVLLNAEARQIEPAGGGQVRLLLHDAGGDRALTGSHLLMAAGRAPNTGDLNLPAAGVQTDKRGFIQVDDRLATNVPHIYAIGDVNGEAQFTHISYDDFRILRCNLIEGGQASTRDRLVPYVVFMDPQLGRIGLSEDQARAAGRAVKVASMPMNYVARALEVGQARGFMKAVVDAATGQILGCAILGIEGGELMSMLEIAMLGKLPYTVLKEAIFAHPTLAESFNNLFANLK